MYAVNEHITIVNNIYQFTVQGNIMSKKNMYISTVAAAHQ